MTAFHRLLPFSTRRHGLRSTSPLGGTTGAGQIWMHPESPSGSSRGAARRSRGVARPGLELMEERTMLSNIPVFETVSVTNGSNPVIAVSPMEQTVVSGHFTGSASTDKVQVQLQAGEIFTAGLDVNYNGVGNWGSGLSVYGPNGAQVASQSTAIWSSYATDPVTGASTLDDSVSFRAPSAGTYEVQAAENSAWASIFGPGSYTLTLRPIELNTGTLAPDANPQDAQKLAFTGGALYAYLDAGKDTLTLAGPTGQGFTISEPAGQTFTQTLTQDPSDSFKSSTIVGTGTLTLNTALGGVSLPLPSGFALTVNTTSNGYNGLFGEVASGGASLDFPNSSVLGDLLDPLQGILGSQVASAQTDLGSFGTAILGAGVDLGIALGGQVQSTIPDAPVNPAVPYIYLNAAASATATVGTVDVKAGYSGSIVVDPADPSFALTLNGLPLLSHYTLGISQDGYIPFTPTDTPSHFAGQTLYGDFYTSTTIDLGPVSGGALPFEISEDVLVNLNTTGTGWTSTIESDANSLASGNILGLIFDPYNFALGVNFGGGVSLGLPGVAGISIPLASGTLIIDGPADQVDVAASTAGSPLAGTPLACLGSGTTLALDGYVQTNTGQFALTGSTTLTVFGYQVGGASFTLNNAGLSFSGETSFLGFTAGVWGTMNYNGTFSELAGNAYVDYTEDLAWDGWGMVVNVSANVSFDIQNGDLQYWASAWGNLTFYANYSQVGYIGGSFYGYGNVNFSSFNVWNLIDNAIDDLD